MIPNDITRLWVFICRFCLRKVLHCTYCHNAGRYNNNTGLAKHIVALPVWQGGVQELQGFIIYSVIYTKRQLKQLQSLLCIKWFLVSWCQLLTMIDENITTAAAITAHWLWHDWYKRPSFRVSPGHKEYRTRCGAQLCWYQPVIAMFHIYWMMCIRRCTNAIAVSKELRSSPTIYSTSVKSLLCCFPSLHIPTFIMLWNITNSSLLLLQQRQ